MNSQESLIEHAEIAERQLQEIERHVLRSRENAQAAEKMARERMIRGEAWILPPFLMRKLVGIFKGEDGPARARQFVQSRLNDVGTHVVVTDGDMKTLFVPDQPWIGLRKGEGKDEVHEKLTLPSREEWRMIDGIEPINQDVYWTIFKERREEIIAAFPKPEHRNGNGGFHRKEDNRFHPLPKFMQKPVVRVTGKTEKSGGRSKADAKKAARALHDKELRQKMRGVTGSKPDKSGGTSKKSKGGKKK